MSGSSSISMETLEEFTAALAEKTSIPGGGAAAGSALAHGAGLGGMVTSFSLGKKSLLDHQEMLGSISGELDRIRVRGLELADADAAAFAALAATWTEEPKASIEKQIETIRNAITPPLDIVTEAGTAADALARLVGRSNRRLVSDLAIAAGFVALAAEAAAWNVEMNLDALRALPGEDASIDLESADLQRMVETIRSMCDRIVLACRTAPAQPMTD